MFDFRFYTFVQYVESVERQYCHNTITPYNMKNLNLNVTAAEIAKIVKEQKTDVKDNYSQAKNLALISGSEKFKLTELQKFGEFYSKNRKQCEEFERKIDEMLDEHNIEYRDIFEGDYIYFYQTWVEDDGHTFEELWEMMKPVIEEFQYPFITYHILYVCFENEYV